MTNNYEKNVILEALKQFQTNNNNEVKPHTKECVEKLIKDFEKKIYLRVDI